MARRDTKARKPSARKAVASMPIVNPNTAAIDVHADNHVVCVPADRATPNVRTFGANSCDLLQIAAWLKQCSITTVAIESTGIGRVKAAMPVVYFVSFTLWTPRIVGSMYRRAAVK